LIQLSIRTNAADSRALDGKFLASRGSGPFPGGRILNQTCGIDISFPASGARMVAGIPEFASLTCELLPVVRVIVPAPPPVVVDVPQLNSAT